MATVSAKSAVYDTSTQKYRVILENAILVKWDRDSTQLVIEMEKDTVSLSPTISVPRWNGVKPTLILKTPMMTSTHSKSTPHTPIFAATTTSNKSNSRSSNHQYTTLPLLDQHRYQTSTVCTLHSVYQCSYFAHKVIKKHLKQKQDEKDEKYDDIAPLNMSAFEQLQQKLTIKINSKNILRNVFLDEEIS